MSETIAYLTYEDDGDFLSVLIDGKYHQFPVTLKNISRLNRESAERLDREIHK